VPKFHYQNLKAKPYASKKLNDHVWVRVLTTLPSVHVNFSSCGRCLDCKMYFREQKYSLWHREMTIVNNEDYSCSDSQCWETTSWVVPPTCSLSCVMAGQGVAAKGRVNCNGWCRHATMTGMSVLCDRICKRDRSQTDDNQKLCGYRPFLQFHSLCIQRRIRCKITVLL